MSALPYSLTDLWTILPELFLTQAALGLLIFAAVTKRESEALVARLSLLTIAVTLCLLFVSASMSGTLPREVFAGMLTLDRFGIFFKVLILLACAATILFSLRFVGRSPYPGGEYYGLILFSAVGMLFMVSGTHLVSIYIALETMALSQYVLAGYFKRESKSLEAAAKYFVLGAFSSGILLYGLSLVYGSAGT
ncbi:MAG TPA: proton-conducting transporter membrane subunit, partial [Thermoanaerobaculia bacterium]|nr:proton-conducting transporter membrane subunit [Thermoanaerobaculia bacterium]